MKTAYQLYMREIENIPPLTKNAERAHFIAWRQHGIKSSRDKIYKANLRLVVKVAHKYKNQGIEILELINEGNLGLNAAMERFEIDKHLKFISYAVWYIRQAMLEHLARQSRFVSITGAEAVFKANLNKAAIKLMQKLDREPTIKELSIETGFPVRKIDHMEKMLKNDSARSLDTPIVRDNHSKITVKDTIEDDKFGSPVPCDNMTVAVLKLFEQADLNAQEVHVLKSYFGIEQPERNLEEISFDYSITRERIRQIKEKALETLKDFDRRSKKLKSYQRVHLTKRG